MTKTSTTLHFSQIIKVNKLVYFSKIKLIYETFFHKGICKLQAFDIPIDCLVLVSPRTSVKNLYDIISEKLNLYLQAVKQCYLNYFQVSFDSFSFPSQFKSILIVYIIKNETNFKAEVYHFLLYVPLLSANMILTTVYPNNHNEDQLGKFI